ncbi:gypsy type transposase [Tanacetum coccineum]
MARDMLRVQATSVAFEFVFSTSGRVLSIRRTRLTPAFLEMCMCLKDHLDKKDRIQNTSSLEHSLDFEEDILEAEVQDNEAIPLFDEEITLDEAASEAMSNGSGRGVSSGGGQSSLNYLFGSGDEPKPSKGNAKTPASAPATRVHVVGITEPTPKPATSVTPPDIAKQVLAGFKSSKLNNFAIKNSNKGVTAYEITVVNETNDETALSSTSDDQEYTYAYSYSYRRQDESGELDNGRVSLLDAWVTGHGSPYYPVDNRVVAVRNVDVLPRCPMLCLLLFLAWSWVTICRVAPCASYASRGAVAACSLWILLGVGLGPIVYCAARACGLLPDRNAIIKDSPEGKIGMYTRFIEFANYRVPLSKFLLCVLEYYQIKLSQLSVIGVAKIDALVCPLSTSWFSSTSVVKDPLPVDEAVDLPCVELLNENRTLIRKYPETFLCFVGLSRSFTEIDVRPTLLHDNDEEMGLLDFVKSVDPFKVKVGERTLAENEVPLINETEDRVISPSLQTISLVDHTIQDELNVNSGKRRKRVAFVSGSPPAKKARTEGIVISDSRPSTAGKSSMALRRLIRQGEQAAIGSGSAAAATEDVTSSFVTPTPERALEDAPCDNVRTRPPSGRFVVLSSGSVDIDIPATSQAVLLVSSSQAGTSVPVAESSGDGHPLSAPELETGTLVTNNARVDNHVTCQNLLDHVTSPGYWAMLCNQHDAGFLDRFNINSAQHVCMVSELHLGYEHEIMTREKYEKRFTDSAALVQQRDAEVAKLKAKLEKLESEAAEVEELRKRVSDLEATIAVKFGKAASLIAQNSGLLEKVSALDLERDGLKGQVVGESKMQEEFLSHQEAAERRFAERAAELDARITDVRRDIDNDLYPHMLTAIAGRRWVVGHGFRLVVHKCARSFEIHFALGKVILMAINKGIQEGLEAGVVHGRAGRSLAQIEAYDPEVEGKIKDSPIALIMSALTLKDDQGNTDTTPEFARFQPSLDQVVVPIYSESGFVDREMLLSDAIPAIHQSAESRGLCPPSSSAPG